MDPSMLLLLRDVMRLSASAFINYLRLGGKTEEEIKTEFAAHIKIALDFDVNDIKDV